MVGSGGVREDLTAALIVIGNEILSGKVTDTNTPFLARELRHEAKHPVRTGMSWTKVDEHIVKI